MQVTLFAPRKMISAAIWTAAATLVILTACGTKLEARILSVPPKIRPSTMRTRIQPSGIRTDM